VVRATPLALTPTRVGIAPGAFVLLLATDNRIGRARLAVVDADGPVRSVELARTRASAFFTGGRQRRPGLAVDPEGRRAYVVGAGEPVAEVDLRTLRVSYHELGAHRSALGRVRDWLEPEAAAKGALDGPDRHALWLGNGLLAVTGQDGRAVRTRRGEVTGMSTTPAGLDVVDVRAWRAVHLGRRTTDAALVEGRLLGFGVTFRRGRTAGAGLDVYARGTSRPRHLFGTSPIWWTQGLGRTAVVGVGDSPTLVDLASASVVRRLPARVPLLLVGGARDGL
jgi:hypothetical protein